MKQKYNNEPDLNIADIENKLVTVALARTSGHRGDAAELLRISQRSLKRKIALRRAKDEQVLI